MTSVLDRYLIYAVRGSQPASPCLVYLFAGWLTLCVYLNKHVIICNIDYFLWTTKFWAVTYASQQIYSLSLAVDLWIFLGQNIRLSNKFCLENSDIFANFEHYHSIKKHGLFKKRKGWWVTAKLCRHQNLDYISGFKVFFL